MLETSSKLSADHHFYRFPAQAAAQISICPQVETEWHADEVEIEPIPKQTPMATLREIVEKTPTIKHLDRSGMDNFLPLLIQQRVEHWVHMKVNRRYGNPDWELVFDEQAAHAALIKLLNREISLTAGLSPLDLHQLLTDDQQELWSETEVKRQLGGLSSKVSPQQLTLNLARNPAILAEQRPRSILVNLGIRRVPYFLAEEISAFAERYETEFDTERFSVKRRETIEYIADESHRLTY